MKRSEINALIRRAEEFLDRENFHLPPFARWTPEEFQARKDEASELIDARLGWDITDYGLGEFEQTGLVLFTIRNGNPKLRGRRGGKTYAEKILISEKGQLAPMHFHRAKSEDIIVRGGAGRLVVQLYNSRGEAEFADTPVTVMTDGVPRTVPAGGTIGLGLGEIITLTAGCFHAFWAEDDRVLLGEVSMVNDDETDNYFNPPVGRFPQIEEDVPPYRLIVPDYINL